MKEQNKNFRVYKSSAGSGKTTTLVMEYLRLAIPTPDSFNEIVGITFTIKATNEMKSRVIETLENIINSGNDFDDISNIIYEEVRKTYGFSKEQFKEKALQLLRNILHNYSGFAFSTIDSFVVKIVKSFAFDLKLPLNFDIELDTKVVIDEAVSALISQAGYDKRLTNNLLKYIEHQADEGADTRIHILVAKLAEVLFNDSFSEFQKTIGSIDIDELQVFADLVIKRRNILFNRIKELGSDALNLIDIHNIEYKSFYFGNSGGIPAYFNYLKKGNIDKLIPGPRLVNSLEDDIWFTKKCPAEIQSEILSISEGLKSLFDEAQSLIPEFIGFNLLRKNIEAILLLGEVNHEIQNYYQENSVIHLSETVKRVAEVVSKEQMPFIYERIGTKYRHYLIDEFQDTSVVQWQNLVPLIDNSLSEGNYNLVVGDAKQSIYRWRGGDFQQFVGLPQLIDSHKDSLLKEREINLSRNFKEIVLDTNYRSFKSVVAFNNEYYEFVKNSANEIIRHVFKDHQQKYYQQEEGYVELEFFPKHNEEDDNFQTRILSIINDITERHFSYQDITILTRTNKQLSFIADLLLSHNVPIITSGSLKIFSSVHIRFVISIIRWLYEKEDRISRTAFLFYLLHEEFISEEEFGEYEASVSDSKIIDFIFSHDEANQNITSTHEVTLIIEFLANRFQLFEKDYAFIIQLLNFAKKAEIIEGQGYMNFLEYFEKKANEEYLSMPDDLDAINLMTIHKAKGLEFPIVIWFDFTSYSGKGNYLSVDLEPIGFKNPESMLVMDNKQLENSVFKSNKEIADKLKEADQINEAYVATTRPKKELYIIAEEKSIHFDRLKSFVKQSELFTEKEDDCCFSTGVKTKQISKLKSNPDTKVLDNAGFIPWNQRVSLRHNYLQSNSQKNTTDYRKQGIRIHNLLSEIKTAKDIKPLLNREISLGKLRSDESENYEILLRNIIDDKEVAPYFDGTWEVINERAIISADQNIFRPDRVLVKDNYVVVIDYKFSDNNKVSDSQKQHYFTQIERYIKLLREIYTSKKITGYILWLKSEVVLEEVPLKL